METVNTSKVNKTIKFTPLNIKKEYEVNEKKDVATLSWGIKNGYPRVTVNLSGVKTTTPDYTKLITAPFDYLKFGQFLAMFKQVIYSKEEISRKVDCLNVKWVNGVKTNEIYVQASVTVGKDKEGIIFLAVIEDKKIKVKFDIIPPEVEFHRWYDANGNVIESKGELSKNRAISYVDILEKLTDSELLKDGVYLIEKYTGMVNTKPNTIVDNTNTLTQENVEKTSDEINIDDLF